MNGKSAKILQVGAVVEWRDRVMKRHERGESVFLECGRVGTVPRWGWGVGWNGAWW